MKAHQAKTDADWLDVARWYHRAADAGHSGAMASLAQMYERGLGVTLDRSAALGLYRLAETAGHVGAAMEACRLEAEALPSGDPQGLPADGLESAQSVG
jgi:localization factor PodJL